MIYNRGGIKSFVHQLVAIIKVVIDCYLQLCAIWIDIYIYILRTSLGNKKRNYNCMQWNYNIKLSVIEPNTFSYVQKNSTVAIYIILITMNEL